MGFRTLSLFLVIALCDAAKRNKKSSPTPEPAPISRPSVVSLDIPESPSPKPVCTGESILPKGLKAYEPSDVVWDPREGVLYSVSDSGTLVAQTLTGELKRQWEVGKTFDLEGVTLVPEEADRVYLGRELPATIHRFDVKTGKISKSWGIQSILEQLPLPKGKGKTKDHGIESLLYVPDAGGRYRGYFLAGRQTDAVLFVFGYTYADTLSYRGWIRPPGPSEDLSALTLSPNKTHVWLLFDGPKALVSMNITDIIQPDLAAGNMTRDMRLFRMYESWVLEYAGQEGICHAEKDGQSSIILAVDKKGDEKIFKFPTAVFQSCFLYR